MLASERRVLGVGAPFYFWKDMRMWPTKPVLLW